MERAQGPGGGEGEKRRESLGSGWEEEVGWGGSGGCSRSL